MTTSETPDKQHDGGVAVLPEKPKLKKPSLYNVILVNDDYTPMEFVVHVLQLFFSIQEPKAVQIMMQIHTQGRGVCGTYTHEIAETKMQQTNNYAQRHNHPLLCILEPA